MTLFGENSVRGRGYSREISNKLPALPAWVQPGDFNIFADTPGKGTAGK